MKFDSIIILGATATGKTAFSVNLAQKINGEIINADSQQIYKKLNIGTAKVSKEEMQHVPHHLFDIINVGDDFSVSEYKRLALDKINALKLKNKVPVIVGGTGFYIHSLLYDLEFGNSKKNEELRYYYENLAIEKGNIFVYEILKEIDPKTAEKLHYNDLKRVIRAIEIAKTSSSKKSDQEKHLANYINPLIIQLNCDREVLYSRINKRVDIMMEDGLFNEVIYLKNNNFYDLDVKLPIGYSEWSGYFKNEITKEQVIELIKQHSRNYAKRQITWFKQYCPHIIIDLTKTDLKTAVESTLKLFCE